MKKSLLIVGLLAILASTALAQGPFLTASIPFEFVIAGKAFPAGDYDFKMAGPDDRFVQMTNHKNGAVVASIMPITRIAAEKHQPAGTGRISFDVREGKRFIEAVWPASGDGYLLHAVKGEHSHEIVPVKQ